ncbi:DUF4062 domain-containing protein [Micromonospora zamorensis]|uniref:DUF4062 domain-containing protein n=1 Tax=Micromonospora zamorensis TaxID=709883 RepID=UPI00386E1536|nr:DUF4062 domain-containing protein [Micromonospora zamorensis]
MQVFISSVIKEYEEFRAAARRAIEALGHRAVGAEDFPASASTPQQACLAAVRNSDLIVLLIGQRYGDRLDSGRSATHEEYEEAKTRKPVLLFVEDADQHDAAQRDFLAEVQDWSHGNIRATYGSPDEVQSRVTRAIHDFELALTTGPVDEGEMLQRAAALFSPTNHNQSDARIELSLASGPLQQVIRPAELEDRRLALEIQQQAMFADHAAVFDTAEGTRISLASGRLVLDQARSSIVIDETATILISQAAVAHSGSRTTRLSMLIEEDLADLLRQALTLGAWLLDKVDPLHRLSDVVPVVRLSGSGYLAWQTRSAVPSNSVALNIRGGTDDVSVNLTPARRHRRALTSDTSRIVEDLVTLLRRQKRM